ncbi:MAG: hypothetical protein U5Q44_08350 [Dehalococcoidia bacterium]|nr:hypothetical protein [Dehalococcoidia bacterium]
MKAMAFRFTVFVAGRWPRVSYMLAWVAGWAAYAFRPGARGRAKRNLLPACDGDRKRAAREARKTFQNVAAYYVDMAALPTRDVSRIEAQDLEIVNAEYLEALWKPGPLIGVSAHMGNPEIAVQALTPRGRQFAALVEQLRPESFARVFKQTRESAGGLFVEANRAGLRTAVEQLRRGNVIGITGDRDIQGRGVCVDLLGRRARLPRGPWELARKEHAMVLPVFCERLQGPRMRVHIEEPFRVECSDQPERDICDAMQRWAKLFERRLREAPGQWYVLEDYWGIHQCRGNGEYGG